MGNKLIMERFLEIFKNMVYLKKIRFFYNFTLLRRITLSYKVLFVSCIAMPFCANAYFSYTVPLVSAARVDMVNSSTRFTVSVGGYFVPGEYALTSDTTWSELTGIKNIPGGSGWNWGIIHRKPLYSGLPEPMGIAKDSLISGSSSDSLSRIMTKVSIYNNRQITITDSGNIGQSCVTAGFWSEGGVPSSALFEQRGNYIWSGGNPTVPVLDLCIGTPPPNEWCAMSSPSVTISYGTIRLQDLEAGISKTTNINVTCTTGMKYSLSLKGSDDSKIGLSNGLEAILEADGKPINGVLNSVEGVNNVTLKSTLEGITTKTGDFSGSGILYVTYP